MIGPTDAAAFACSRTASAALSSAFAFPLAIGLALAFAFTFALAVTLWFYPIGTLIALANAWSSIKWLVGLARGLDNQRVPVSALSFFLYRFVNLILLGLSIPAFLS